MKHRKSRGLLCCRMAVLLPAVMMLVSSSRAAAAVPHTGFPVANFGIGAEVSPSGRLMGRIVYNPPALGQWLEDAAEGYFTFEAVGHLLRDEEFERRSVTRGWPFAHARLTDQRLANLTVDFTAFAPVVRDNPFDAALPAVFAEFTFQNAGAAMVPLTVTYHCEGNACAGMLPDGNLLLPPGGGLSVSSEPPGEKISDADGTAIRWRVNAPGQGTSRLRILFFRFHENGYTAIRLRSPQQLAEYAFKHWDKLRAATQDFSDNLPLSGNAILDDALRWYMTAGVLLTKLTRDGHTLTMGYTELNQRDSYWTSFVHLVHWPELERKMIEESAAAQREDGKIPTTILPVIERNDDIDINCYFILRVFRWAAYREDMELLRCMWPHVKAAFGFLQSMDHDGDGLPEQQSFWADWKDVPGMDGRKYGPHFTLLWLAVLKRAKYWARKLGDESAANDYKLMYEKGLVAANRSVDEGGLWNGAYYVNFWRDGRTDDRVLEDQVVGILFGVVDEARAESIYESLMANECPWGVRETFPYYHEESFGLRGGDYHNGAVWPYLNFIDALSRIRNGRRADGIRIMEKVANADLVLHGDFLPHENIDGETGENTHKYIQGWNAAYYAAFYFGLIEPDAPFF